jgi:hypothetical protein
MGSRWAELTLDADADGADQSRRLMPRFCCLEKRVLALWMLPCPAKVLAPIGPSTQATHCDGPHLNGCLPCNQSFTVRQQSHTQSGVLESQVHVSVTRNYTRLVAFAARPYKNRLPTCSLPAPFKPQRRFTYSTMPSNITAPGLDSLVAHFGLSLVDKDGGAVTTTTPESKKDDDTPAGSLCSSVPIYQGEPDSQGRMTWSADKPEDVPEAAENEKTLGHAVVIRNKKSQDSRKQFEIHSIVIQSPHLKKALAEVFDGYPGVSCDLSRLIFRAPFQPFVHRWSRFVEYMGRDHKDQETKDHLKLLQDILTEELSETIKALEDYIKHGVVTFEHVWTLFAPDTILVAPTDFGLTRASVFTAGFYGEDNCGKYFGIHNNYIDVDGERFGYVRDFIRLAAFDGVRKIHSLKAIPLNFCPDKEEISKALAGRGRKFEELAGFHYKSYVDQAIEVVEDQRGQRRDKITHVSGRVVIDAGSWNDHNADFADSMLTLKQDAAAQVDESLKSDESDTDSSYSHLSAEQTSTDPAKKTFQTLSEAQHILCAALVRGYSLKLKKWLKFKIDSVNPINWSGNAFDSLVLPPSQKELVLALTQTQVTSSSSNFDDVIHGKGRGMILLLTGPPGVGKTLTAESTAEAMHTPLFMMGAGDLGTEASEVESKLDGILTLVAKWKAILLIDECDVFLEARSVHDLERNKLVSIFLRLLEYYEGILFLTTNRVKEMDDAFQSRIHLTIAYDQLSKDSRKVIWQNFVREMKYQSDFKNEDLEELAELELNGRQIKNVLKSAVLVAGSKGEVLGKKHVETVLRIENKGTAEDRARL